ARRAGLDRGRRALARARRGNRPRGSDRRRGGADRPLVPRPPGVPVSAERVLGGSLNLAGFTLTHELSPRFRDTDAMGHINNAVYVTYLEVARQEYWRAYSRQVDYRRVPFILAHVTIDFRSEALVNER